MAAVKYMVLAGVVATGCACAWGEGRDACNVRDFGAKGDRQTLDHAAIQAAVDACHKAGGGTVVLPPGDYLAATIRLRSGVTLRIDKGATLWASTDPAHYGGAGRANLLVADDAKDVAVVGAGTINGQGTADYGSRWGAPKKPAFRTGILLFAGCHNVSVTGVTIRDSDAWTLHFKRCENVVVDRVTIRNNYRRLNSDGIDPNSCKHVRITNCDIRAGDDCIVLKTTEPYPCEDVVVRDCVLESAASAIKLGTESHGDFRDIVFENCVIRNSFTGIGFYLKDGGTMERVRFRNISIETPPKGVRTVTPVFLDIERRHKDSKAGTIRDVTFENLDVRSGSGILIQGMPESPIQDLALRNVRFRVEKADDYSDRKKPVGGRRTLSDQRDTCYARLPSYVTLAHVKGLVLENVEVTVSAQACGEYDRSAVCVRALDGGVLRRVVRRPPPQSGQMAAIDIQDCRNVRVENAR
ncbi:MAG TPA: glycoside hydrolase family 28 protein [Phycisphaerae bacterium]|nr:glycoside hydrolase family 28 protein [Phycisphaerae bacterium]